jgi:hypothetical protein
LKGARPRTISCNTNSSASGASVTFKKNFGHSFRALDSALRGASRCKAITR